VCAPLFISPVIVVARSVEHRAQRRDAHPTPSLRAR
jgi:hypothetical protein